MADSDSALPPLYRGWLEPVLGPVRGESRATCMHCPMVRRFDEEPLELAFDSRTKCCTYVPDVHNFNAGRILADDNPVGAEARRVLRSRIAERVGVTPLAIAMPPIYRTFYESSPSAFGRAPAMRCPYYVDEGGLCGIWQHRDAVCSTWFCKVDKGALGKVYWKVVSSLIYLVESTIRVWALGEAGLDEEAWVDMWSRTEAERRGPRPQLDEHTMNGTVNPERYKKDWANFLGREEELYRRCAEIVNALGSDDVMRLGGAPLAAAIHAAKHVLRKITEMKLPERVVSGNLVNLQLRRGGELRVRHQAIPCDWIDVPEAAARQVYRLYGGPLREVLAELQREGVPIDEELVQKLLAWQVLVEA